MSKYDAVVEKTFDYKGYTCVVLMQASAFRTGYVGLPKESKFYLDDYSDIPVVCHGGLTYSSTTLPYHEEDGLWWIGFDTAHYMDSRDYKCALELFKGNTDVVEFIKRMEEFDSRFYTEGYVRSLEYCEYECESIVDQIIKLEGEN